MITIYTGIPGSGKSLKSAQQALELLERNKKWYKKTGIKRQLCSNIKFSPHVEHYFGDLIHYWTDPYSLVQMRDVDVIWDEIATYLDSTQWANVPLELKRWLQQHRKFGIDIYGNTQDFAMVDISMRRMTEQLFYMRKLIGSPDKSATKPKIKNIWGIIMVRELDPQAYKEESKANKGVGLPHFIWVSRSLIEVFDTAQEIEMGKYPPLRHIERECERCALGTCTHRKIIHV